MGVKVTNRLEDVFIEAGGKLCDIIGWRRIIGRVYVLLYITDRPLSLDDIVERVNMSKSTVWVAVKTLQRLCAVNITENREGKKGYYTAERDLDVIFKNGIVPELSSKLLFASSYLEQAQGLLADFRQDTKEINPKELARYHDFIKEFAKQKNKLDFFLR